jgi:SagB-type dehydrogenase family enzyme
LSNEDAEAARAYHEATKLTYINLANKPPLYKTYSALPQIPLPSGFPSPDEPTLQAVSSTFGLAAKSNVDQPSEAGSLDIMALSQLLFFSAGLVRKASLEAVGEVHYRAAASAGALYPIDVYLVCQDISGLEAGVYHFSPVDFALRPLRKGDYREELVEATGNDSMFADAPATLVFTANFWRSAWKYRARGYRYCYWDCGTMLANLLAVCSSLRLPANLTAGFVDDRLDQLLRIRGQQEATICLVPIGMGGGQPSAIDLIEPAPLASDTRDGSSGRIDYPETDNIHEASSLMDQEEVMEWRGLSSDESPWAADNPPSAGLPRLEANNLSSEPLGEVIRKRGSTRRFARDPISQAQFEAILAGSSRGTPSDFQGKNGGSLVDMYTIVHAVDGVPAGSYYFAPETGTLELLREGNLRERAGHLVFEQALGADASAVTFFMADLEDIFQRYGNRGYRAAQLEAGIVGGKMYLSAHSLGLGATGMTFYDDEVTEFFSPHAEGKSLMFLVAVGKMGRPNRVRPFRSQIAVTLDALARGAS